MAGSHETNPNTKKATTSKKSKSKSSKSGHSHSEKSGKSHEHHERREQSGQTQGQNEQVQEQPGHSERVQEQPGHTERQQEQSKRKGKKKVQFSEEPSSKRQRVEEDDPLVYRDGPLEDVSSKFETIKPYFNNGMFIDLAKIDELGFPHLRPFLERYMPWLGIDQEYNINVRGSSASLSQGRLNIRKWMGRNRFADSPSQPP